MKYFFVSLFLFFTVFPVIAQSHTNQQTFTTPPESGVYEIITSSIAVRHTYLLNKKTGDTWQLVSTSDGYTWQEIPRQSHPSDIIPENHTGAVYQITLSGIAARASYLLNTLTGATWTMYQDPNTDQLFWGTIE